MNSTGSSSSSSSGSDNGLYDNYANPEERAIDEAVQEGFDYEISINMYEDSLDGDCSTTASLTCNLRAAIRETISRGGSGFLYAPADETHYVTEGKITIPAGSTVKLSSPYDLATIDGSGNLGDRLFHVRKGGYLELAMIMMTSFTAGEGACVYNE